MTELSPPRRLDLTVVGRVQGVGFRMFVFDRARALELRGWVANEARSSVRVVAEGPEDRLLELLVAVREGPAAARVDHVAEAWSAAEGTFKSFGIRSGWHGGD